MALNEKHFADVIVEWRYQESIGTGYVPIADAIDVAVKALEELQQARAEIGRMGNLVEAAVTA